MAAAGTSPTISTFLELRDNMSAGLKSVTSEINRLNQAAKDAEDAIRRMKAAQGARPPRPPAPPAPPRGPRAPGAPGAPSGRPDQFFRFEGGIFNAVTRANLLVDAIENAVVGATRAVAGLLKYTVKVGEEYENTQLRITNTFASMSISPTMETAYARSLEVTKTLRDMAAKLPGEAKDYYSVFTAALPDALAAGMTDIKKYTDFAAKYTAVAISRLVDAPQAGRDLQEMLQGRAHLRTKTFQELRTYIGMTALEFNKLAPEQRMQTLMGAIAKASGGMAMAAETANAKFGELQSRIDEIFIMGGQPFFEGVKSVVTDINKLLETNKDKIIEITRAVSTGLGDAMRGILSIATSIGGAFNSVLDSFNSISKSPFFELLGGGALVSAGKGLALSFAERFYPFLTPARDAFAAGAETRLSEEAEKRRRIAEEQEAIRKKYAWAGMPSREEFFGVPYAPGSTESMMATRAAEARFKRMAPVEGFNSFFESQKDWATYGGAMGFDEKTINRIWDELIAEKRVKVMVAPTTTRELKVEFNNNRFDIHQQFAEGFDPDRIAVAFASDLARAGEMKVQAAFSPIYGAGQ